MINPALHSLALQESLISNQAAVRLAVVPAQIEQLVDPAVLGSTEFRGLLYMLAHDPKVALLNFERRKSAASESGMVVITQAGERRQVDSVDEVVIKVGGNGTIVIDANVTGWVKRATDAPGALDAHVIAIEDVEARLGSSFRFVAGLVQEIDPDGRHQQFAYQVIMIGTGARSLERHPRPRADYASGASDRPAIMPMEPVAVSREVFGNPAAEIQCVIEHLEALLAD